MRRFFALDPVPPERLALIRILVGAFAMVSLFTHRAEVASVSTAGAQYLPVGLMNLLPGPLSPDQVSALQWALPVLGAAWTAGFAWRGVGPLFGLGYWLWASWRLSWGSIAHDLHLATMFVLVLSFSPAAGALSLDARFPTPLAERKGEPWTYAWPVRLLAAVSAATYLLAGVAKVRTPAGFGWASGENLLGQMAYARLVFTVYEPSLPPDPVLTWVAQHPLFLRVGATAALALELGAPLALLGGRVRTVWALGILGLHQAIRVLMGIAFPFHSLGFVLLPFFPLERLLPRRWRG